MNMRIILWKACFVYEKNTIFAIRSYKPKIIEYNHI